MADALENLEAMLHVIKGFGEHLPAACQGSCEEAWTIFDAFLAKYGGNYDVSDRVTRVLRHGLALFGPTARPVAWAVAQRMSASFEQTGFAGYLWIAGKLISSFGVDKDQVLHNAIVDLYTRSTNKTVLLLQEKTAGAIPDGV
jgi:transportin-3